jgi:hypothetical protein
LLGWLDRLLGEERTNSKESPSLDQNHGASSI